MESGVYPDNKPGITVVFLGKCGAGKSSTLNALFDLGLATDAAKACTVAPAAHFLDPVRERLGRSVRVVDLPGIGESLAADEHYQAFYEEWIAQADVLVWVTQADTRAYKRDQIFLFKLRSFFKKDMRFLVALNRVDHLGFGDVSEGNAFDAMRPKPSDEQVSLIAEKISDLLSVFKEVLAGAVVFERSQIVPCTASFGWGIDDLKNEVLRGARTDVMAFS